MSRETTRLHEEIRGTRERMSDTLDELGDRLNPNHIKQQVRENIRDATVGRMENMARNAADRVQHTREGILDTIRDNPVPAALVGIGVGWLLLNGRRQTDVERPYSQEYRAAPYQGDISATTPRLRQDDAAGGLGASTSRDEEPGVVERVRESASDVVDQAQERVGDVAGRVQNVASDVAYTTRYQARRVEDRFQQTLYENPLAVGAVALAAGLAAGFAIPETRRESELMGGARDQLVDRAKDVARETRDRAEEVAERALEETDETSRTAL